MKRLHLILTLLALASLLLVAQASADHCASHGASADAAKKASTAGTALLTMGDCCVTAAEAGKGCCGKDAAAIEAKYAAYQAQERALAGMHSCCATAVAGGQGCCGKDPAALQAAYTENVTTASAELAALDSMHRCCAEAVEAGKGCCGQDAEALKASYDQAVADAKAKKVSAAGGCGATCATACGSKAAATPTTGVAAATK